MEYQLSKNIEHYLATLSKMYGLENNRRLQELIVNAQIRIHEEWSFDNWNGGTYGHALYLMLPEQLFLDFVREKGDLQDKLKDDLNKIQNVQNEFIHEVFLEMSTEQQSDWRRESGLLLDGRRTVSEESTDRIWKKDFFRLFFSHKTSVKKETAQLKDDLSIYGISCFVAHEDIQPTKTWQEEIEKALASMDGFVALMTPDFSDSDWTDQEVGYALARGVPIIALKLGKDPYGFIGKFQALISSWETAAEDIAGLLIENDRMFNAYLEELRRCPNWSHANILGKLLPSMKSLDSSQIDKLVMVYNETPELYSAFVFDGTKPQVHGPGLVVHLNRIDSRNFIFTEKRLIEIEK